MKRPGFNITSFKITMKPAVAFTLENREEEDTLLHWAFTNIYLS